MYVQVCPEEGESYDAFYNRCRTALDLLGIYSDEWIEMEIIDRWNSHMLDSAAEVTAVLTRRYPMNSISPDNRWDNPLRISEVLSAKITNITYSTLEKARAGSGDTFNIAKSVEDKQMIFGWANISKDANGEYPLDWQGDYSDPEDLENAAYQFVLKYRETGEQHVGEAVGQMVESVMFTKEKIAAMGIPEGILPEGWWVGFYVPDKEVFQKAKSGEYAMFSVQGTGKRTPVQP